MANSYSCPSCGAPLDYHGVMSTIQCPYCFTSSNVPEQLRAESGVTVEPGVMLNYMAQATTLRELAAAVKAKQTAKAVELYQKAHRVSPDVAARAVARLTGGGTVLVAGGQANAAPSYSTTPDPYSTYSTPPSQPDLVFPTTPSITPQPQQDPPFSNQSAFPSQTYTPATTAYPSATPAPSQTRPRSPVGFLILAVVGLGICCAVGAASFFLFSFSGPGSDVPDATQALVETRIANASTEQSQSSTIVAATEAIPLEPPTVAPPATDAPTPTEDPSFGLTATAESVAQAAADAELLATAKQWPVAYTDDFSKDTKAWITGPENNDYYSGSHNIVDGVFRWDLKTKSSVVSFITPDPYKSVTDFFAAVDMVIKGPDTSAGGLVFRDEANDNGGYYVFVVSPNGNYTMTGYQGSTTIAHNGSIEPLAAGTNRLAVLGQGSHFLLLINDKVIDSLDDPFLKAGDIGVAISLDQSGDTATFDFDNFEIRTPPQ
jgi:hypothetical protein